MAEEQEVQEVQTPPPGDDLQKVYNAVHEKGLYTKSYDEFKSKYSNPEAIDKLYDVVTKEGLYTKPKADFVSKYFTSPGTPRQQAIAGAQSTLKTAFDEHGDQSIDALNQDLHAHNFSTQRQDLIQKQDATYNHVELPKMLQQDIEEKRNHIKQNLTPEMAREISIKTAHLVPEKKNDIQAANYLLDRGEEGDEKKVLSNAEKIKSGDLQYNIAHKKLIKPLGPIESIAHGFKERNKSLADYKFLNSASDDDIAKKYNEELTVHNPDDATPTPQNYGELTSAVGSEGPAMVKSAGAALGVSFIPGGQAVAPEAAYAASAPEYFERSYADKFKQSYGEAKSKGLDDKAAIEKARSDADFSAKVSLATGAAMTAGGARLAQSMTAPTEGLKKGVAAVLEKSSAFTVNALKEGTINGTIAAGGHIAENVHDGKNATEGAGDAFVSGVLLPIALGALMHGTMKAGTKIAGKTITAIKQGLIKQPPAVIDATLGEMQQEGHIKPEDAVDIKTQLDEHRELDSKIPDNVVNEESRIKIQDRIKRRAELEDELKGLDKFYQPEVKEKIAKVDEQIGELTEEGRKKPEKPTEEKPVVETPADKPEGKIPEKTIETRHGATDEDKSGLVSGQSEVPLNEEGKKGMEKVAEDVKDKGITKVISSDLPRAKESAQVVADKIGAEVETNPKLRSWDVGEFSKTPEEGFKKAQKFLVDNPDAKEFEGKKINESFNEYKDRVEAGHAEVPENGTLLVNHSQNMLLRDAIKDNGGWNEAAKKQYLGAETPELSTIQKKKPKKLSENREKATSVEDLTSPRDVALQYFSGEGKIHPSSVKDLLGSNGESKARIGLMENKAATIDRVAHDMWEAGQDHAGENPHSTQDYKNAIEDVLREHVSKESMAKEIVDTYVNKSVKENLTEAEAKHIDKKQISLIHEHVKELHPDSQNELKELLKKYQNEYGLVDWEKIKEDSGGFDPDILNLSEKTLNDLNEIVHKNTAGHGEPDNVRSENSSSEKVKEKNTTGTGDESPSRKTPEGQLAKLDGNIDDKAPITGDKLSAKGYEINRKHEFIKTPDGDRVDIYSVRDYYSNDGLVSEGNALGHLPEADVKLILKYFNKEAKEEGLLSKLGDKSEKATTPKQYSSPERALEAIKEEHPDNKLLNETSDFLSHVLKGKDVKIENAPNLRDSQGRSAVGLSHPDSRIEVDFAAHPDLESAHRTLAHELMHEATRREIFDNKSLQGELDARLDEVREAMKLPKGSLGDVLIPELVSKGVINADTYGTTNAHEMLAEVFTNQKFFDLLKDIKYKGESILKRIFDTIVGFFDKKYGALAKLKSGIKADNMADYLMELTKKHFQDQEKANPDKEGTLASLAKDPHSAIREWIKKASDLMTDQELKEALMKHTKYSEDEIDRFILNDRALTPEALLTQKLAEITKDRKTIGEKVSAAVKAANDGLTEQEKADIKSSKGGVKIISPAVNVASGLINAYHAVAETLVNKPKFTDMDKAIGEYSLAKQENDKRIMEFAKNVVREVPSKARREAISNWMEANGDMQALKDRADATDGKHKAGYIIAQHLTPHELKIAEAGRNYFDTMFKAGIKHGLLKSMIDNYVAHIGVKANSAYMNELQTDIASGKLNSSFQHAKKRVFETFFDLEKAGFEAKTKDVAEIIAAYSQTFNKTLFSRAFIKNATIGKAADGRPLITQAGFGQQIPSNDPQLRLLGEPSSSMMVDPYGKPEEYSDYKSVNHFALRDWFWATKDAEGNPVFAKGDLVVHPDEFKRLGNMLGKSSLRDYAAGRASMAASNIVKQTIFSLSPIFHYVQEGQHAIFHRVNPFWGLKEPNYNDPIQRELAIGGLKLYDFHAASSFAEGLSSMQLFKKVPVYKDTLLQMQDFLFNSYIPKLKVTMATHAFERNLARNAKDLAANKITRADIAKQSAEQANAAFGHLNYDMIGRNKTTQDVFRTFAIAPDFLEARARFVGQAFTKYGTEQRTALFLGGAAMYLTARALNKMIDDDYHWDEPFSVIHGGKKYRMRTVQEDLVEMMDEPGRFMFNRISPLGQAFSEFVSGYDPVRGRVIDRANELPKDILTSPLPSPIKEFLPDSWNKFPSKTGSDRVWNTFINTIGVRGTQQVSPTEHAIVTQFYKRSPKGEPTKASAIEQQIYQAHQNGNEDKVEELMEELPVTKQKSIRQHMTSSKTAYQAMFERLPAEDKIELFKDMTDEEKVLYDPKGKVQHMIDNGDDK